MSDRLNQSTVFTRALKNRLAEEADHNPHMAFFQAEGDTHSYRSAGALMPEPLQRLIAEDICKSFNKEISMGGTWVVELTHMASGGLLILTEPVYECMRFLFMDDEGDVQFTVECWEAPEDVAMSGMQHWMGQAYDAWGQWKHSQDVLDLSEKHGEVKRVAKGEYMAPQHVDIDIGD